MAAFRVKNSANTSEDLVALRSENEKLKAEIKDLKQALEQLMEQILLADLQAVRLCSA